MAPQEEPSSPNGQPGGSIATDGADSSTPSSGVQPAVHPQTRSHRVMIVLGAVALAVLLVLVLFLSGVIPGTNSSGSGGAPKTEAESAATSSAARILGGIPGGPWNLTLAAGMSRTVSYSQPSSALFGSPSCPLRNSSVSTLAFPGYNGIYYQGEAEAWVLIYNSTTSAGTHLIIFAANGGAGEVGELSGSTSNCGFEPYLPSLPAGVIDSPAAARTALETTAGQSFVSDYPHANASYQLTFETNNFGVIVNDIPVWNINFGACSNGAYTQFQSEVFASNGTLDSAGTALSSCPG
jgi:hypothetical protein